MTTTTSTSKWAESLSVENLFTDRAGIHGSLLALAALPTWLFCLRHHFCMAGHMAHPPYSSLDYGMDFFTITALLSAGTLLVLSSMRLRYAVAGCVAGQLLVATLWDLGPPLLQCLAIVALIGARAWFRRTPRTGRAVRFFTECVWGLVGFGTLLLLGGFVHL
jgi:hypothetical protein